MSKLKSNKAEPGDFIIYQNVSTGDVEIMPQEDWFQLHQFQFDASVEWLGDWSKPKRQVLYQDVQSKAFHITIHMYSSQLDFEVNNSGGYPKFIAFINPIDGSLEEA